MAARPWASYYKRLCKTGQLAQVVFSSPYRKDNFEGSAYYQ